jgi:hypothetical protein
MTREGGGCGDGVDIDGTVVDAENEDGEAYGGDSDVCDWTSGDDTPGEDRFDADLAGHVESLLLSLPGSLSSLELGRRALALADNPEGRDLTVDAVVDPDRDDKRLLEESVPELPTVPLPEADTAFDVDNGIEGIVSVRVEDPLEDGEPEDGALACCDISEEVRDRLGRGGFGNGSVGGGELVRDDPTRLVCAEGATAVDGDFKRFGGDVADSACVAVIEEAPNVIDAGKLEPTGDAELAVVNVRESEAARARSLDGA